MSCSTFRRSTGSGYSSYSAYQLEEAAIRQDRQRSENEDAALELGLRSTRDLSADQAERLENRIQLRRLERLLSTKTEKEQYYRFKPMLSNDGERIEFLRVGSYEGRKKWLNARGYNQATERYSPDVQHAIQTNDIVAGMTKQAVRDSWGEPEEVYVAGNPQLGHERWVYKEQVASKEGYRTENRILIFEYGRVLGWQKQ